MKSMDKFLFLVLVCASVFVGWFQFQMIEKLVNLKTENTRLEARIDSLEQMSGELVNLQTKNTRLEARINSLEQMLDRHPAVAVHARLSGNFPLSGTARVMYDVEITNIGKAFNLQKGHLTAPVSGVYLLHVTACDDHGKWMDLNIMENDKVIGRVFTGGHVIPEPDALAAIYVGRGSTGGSYYRSCGSEALTVHLDVGDIVWVQRAAGIGTALNQGHGWNSFTAALINAD